MSYGWDRGPVGMSQKCQVRTLGIYSAETSVGPLRRLKVAGGATPGSFGLTMGWLLDRTLGSDPVHQGSPMP